MCTVHVRSKSKNNPKQQRASNQRIRKVHVQLDASFRSDPAPRSISLALLAACYAHPTWRKTNGSRPRQHGGGGGGALPNLSLKPAFPPPPPPFPVSRGQEDRGACRGGLLFLLARSGACGASGVGYLLVRSGCASCVQQQAAAQCRSIAAAAADNVSTSTTSAPPPVGCCCCTRLASICSYPFCFPSNPELL